MKICPCCGFKSANSESVVLREACLSCGARSVGEPLPRPEHELPSYARSLVLTVMGSLMVLVFLTQTIIAVAERSTRGATSNLAAFSMIPSDWRLWLAGGETAAWRLKWIMIPLTMLVLFGARKLYRSILAEPSRFCGQRYARRGYAASAAVPLLVLILIGVTVPTRLRHRQWAIEAGDNAYIYRLDRAFEEYRQAYGGLPSDPKDLLSNDPKDHKGLPDADGSIAEALRNIDTTGYRPTANLAAVPNKKPQQLRGAVIRNASISSADDMPGERLSFTNYDLLLPGPDKIMGTEDDLLVRDGVIGKASETPHRGVSNMPTSRLRQP